MWGLIASIGKLLDCESRHYYGNPFLPLDTKKIVIARIYLTVMTFFSQLQVYNLAVLTFLSQLAWYKFRIVGYKLAIAWNKVRIARYNSELFSHNSDIFSHNWEVISNNSDIVFLNSDFLRIMRFKTTIASFEVQFWGKNTIFEFISPILTL